MTIRPYPVLLAVLISGVTPITSTADSTRATAAAEAPAGVPAPEALERLRSGNEAFRRGLVGTNHLTEAYRASLASGQHPFAIVLSCSDSRVPPEQVFAQGLGDLFVVRVAGNVAEPATVASVEYAAAHLGPRLLALPKDASLQTAVCANVHRTREELLRQSALLSGFVRDGALDVREAYYDLATGEVRFLEASPR
jgi:carbonic anhydrase